MVVVSLIRVGLSVDFLAFSMAESMPERSLKETRASDGDQYIAPMAEDW
jgi:hypothetical protein